MKKCKKDCPDEQSPDQPDSPVQSSVQCYNCDGGGEWKSIKKRDLEKARNYPHKIVTRAAGNSRCSVQQVILSLYFLFLSNCFSSFV